MGAEGRGKVDSYLNDQGLGEAVCIGHCFCLDLPSCCSKKKAKTKGELCAGEAL